MPVRWTALCWVHTERTLHRIDGLTDWQRAAVDRARMLIWWFYADLKAYCRDPRDGVAR